MDIYEFMKSVISDALTNGHEVRMQKNQITESSNTLGTLSSSKLVDEGFSVHIYPLDYYSKTEDDDSE